MKETASALVKKTIKGEVTEETAREIIQQLPRVVRIEPQKEQFSRALEIAARNNMTVYDTLFIALCISTNSPLLTSDRQQAEAAQQYGVVVTFV